MDLKRGLSYKKVNEVLIEKIKNGSINEKTIFNSTNYIDEEEKKANGIFYTPTNIVDESHKYLNKVLRKTWKSKYVVWDTACGKANLTKDYKFKNLFLSTLEQTDLDFIEEIGYNKKSVKFQYDFLNDSLSKLPKELKNNLENDKPILFLMNPPYAVDKDNKTAQTMKKYEYNHYTYRLTYIQFLYRILKIKEKYNLTNVKILIISPLSFLTKVSFTAFKNKLFSQFDIAKGFVFDSKEFNVKYGNWLIGTTIFKMGNRKNLKNFKYDIYGTNEQKTLYNITKDDSAMHFVKRHLKKIQKQKYIKALPLKSATFWGGNTITRLTMPKKNIGYYVTNGNNVNSSNYTYLLSSQPSFSSGTPIVEMNINEVVANFTARKAVRKTWLNSYDEYIKPKRGLSKNEEYQQYINDSYVFALFNASSHQSSLRNIKFDGNTYDVKNNWFWMSTDEMKDLATSYKNIAMQKDLNRATNSIVYNKLQNLDLSTDAKAVLDLNKRIVKDSFKYRESYAKENPTKFLNTWDAGWTQIKHMVKQKDNKAFKEFITTYNSFEDRLKKQVYKFELLK